MTTGIYVRHKVGEPREGRVFPPPAEDHSLHNSPCLVCGFSLGGGEPIQLVALGPDSAESAAKAKQHRWYSAVALPLHVKCVRPEAVP